MRLRISAVLAAVAFTLIASVATPALGVGRIDLTQREEIATSVSISRSLFPTSAPAAVITMRSSWRSQIAGAGLAGAVKGPLLVTVPTTLSASVAAELSRLGPQRVYLLASPTASVVLLPGLQRLLPSAEIVFVNVAVPAEAARRTASLMASAGPPPVRALVVSQSSWTSAMSAAAAAAAGPYPVVFGDALHPGANAAALADLGMRDAFILGDVSGVSSAEEASLRAALDGDVRRITGADRYTLARAVNESIAASAGLGFGHPVVVSGSSPTTVTLASVLAAGRRSVVLPTGPSGIGAAFSADLFERRSEVATMAFVGSAGSLPSRVRMDAFVAVRARTFTTANAMAHIKYLAGLGPRKAGSWAERKGAEYVADQLRSYGYDVTTQTFPISGGRTSRNVIAEKRGDTAAVIVLGAHMDSKYPSPGANDNASGVGVTLELARCLADAQRLSPTVRFIGFGSEEVSGPSPRQHHLGSRYYVANLPSIEFGRIESAISIDMVGRGSAFKIRNLRVAPMTTVRSLQSWGRYSAEPLGYLKDFGSDGWSDHEAFEFRGVPSAWIEWRDDPDYHTSRDRYSKISYNRVGRTGKLMRGWLLDLTPAEVSALKP